MGDPEVVSHVLDGARPAVEDGLEHEECRRLDPPAVVADDRRRIDLPAEQAQRPIDLDESTVGDIHACIVHMN